MFISTLASTTSTPIISAFDLYLLLKLDDFRDFFKAMIALGIMATVFIVILNIIIAMCNEHRYPGDSKYIKPKWKWLFLTLPFFIVSVLFHSLLPSTKQMAVITIVPKIATYENADALSKEAKELYQMAKDYFKDNKDDVKNIVDKVKE